MPSAAGNWVASVADQGGKFLPLAQTSRHGSFVLVM